MRRAVDPRQKPLFDPPRDMCLGVSGGSRPRPSLRGLSLNQARIWCSPATNSVPYGSPGMSSDVATTPLPVARPSPPSGWAEGLRLRPARHARRTKNGAAC